MSADLEPRRVWARLTSPRAALWLLVLLAAYIAAAPSLGLRAPYANPVFLAAVAWLALATATCAWRRTSNAFNLLRAPTTMLSATPTFTLRTPRPSVIAEQVLRTLTSLGLRPQPADKDVLATGNRLGLIGSPAFHWALVAVIALAAAGQATRTFALLDLAVGERKPNVAASYIAPPLAGPLAWNRHAGVTLGLERIRQRDVVGGVDRGPVPVVAAWDARGRVLARAGVYPNAPMRLGSLAIHRADMGLAAVVRVADAATGITESRTLCFPTVAGAAKPVRFDLATAAGDITIEATPERGRRIRFTAVAPPQAAGGSVTLTASGADVATLPGGIVLRVASLTRYAQLGLVDDWSTPWLYAAFALALLAIAVTVFAPPRLVRVVMTADKDDAASVEVWVRAARNDPAFRSRVERAFRAAFQESKEPA